MSLARYLDSIEAAKMLREPACSVEYSGEVDTEVLNEAFTILCNRYLVLRAVITRDDQGYLLHVPYGHYPDFVSVNGDEATLISTLRYPNRIDHGLFRLILVDNGNCGHVAIQGNHAAIDARYMVVVFRDLWEIYADLLNRSQVSTTKVVELPLSPCYLMQERWKGSHCTPGKGHHAVPKPRLSSFPEQRRLHLSKSDTRRVISAARQLETSVHALVCGTVIAALRTCTTTPEPLVMGCESVVDLRGRIKPPVGSTDTANLSFSQKVEVVVPAAANSVDIGREIKNQLDASLFVRSRETPCSSSRITKTLPESKHLHQISITNPGIIPTFPASPGIRITDLQWRTEVDNQLPSEIPNAIYIAHTYGDRLSISGIFPTHLFSIPQIDRIVDGCTAQLGQVLDLFA